MVAGNVAENDDAPVGLNAWFANELDPRCRTTTHLFAAQVTVDTAGESSTISKPRQSTKNAIAASYSCTTRESSARIAMGRSLPLHADLGRRPVRPPILWSPAESRGVSCWHTVKQPSPRR